ncbi:MAG: hypothetical protein WCW52_03075 [Elusimicrobiales bacterium]|jgi:hypothetical protein
MTLLLRFTDGPRYELRRLTLALAGLCRKATPENAGVKAELVQFSKAVNKSLKALGTKKPEQANLLSGLETAGACLETVFLDMERHALTPDDEAVEALLFTERALRSQADFLAHPDRKTSLAEAAGNTAAASKRLRSALRASETDGREFIANLKFSRIYSGLEKLVCAVYDYNELLAGTFQ